MRRTAGRGGAQRGGGTKAVTQKTNGGPQADLPRGLLTAAPTQLRPARTATAARRAVTWAQAGAAKAVKRREALERLVEQMKSVEEEWKVRAAEAVLALEEAIDKEAERRLSEASQQTRKSVSQQRSPRDAGGGSQRPLHSQDAEMGGPAGATAILQVLQQLRAEVASLADAQAATLARVTRLEEQRAEGPTTRTPAEGPPVAATPPEGPGRAPSPRAPPPAHAPALTLLTRSPPGTPKGSGPSTPRVTKKPTGGAKTTQKRREAARKITKKNLAAALSSARAEDECDDSDSAEDATTAHVAGGGGGGERN